MSNTCESWWLPQTEKPPFMLKQDLAFHVPIGFRHEHG